MALTQITTDGIKDGTITGTDLTTNIDLVDNQKLRLGTGNDLEIYHDSGNSIIKDAGTGSLLILSSDFVVHNTDASESMLKCFQNGAVELYHNNENKLFTKSNGVQVQDTTATGAYLTMATSSGTAGKLYAVGDNTLGLLDSQNHYMLRGIKDGAVELYHNGTKTFETTSEGATFDTGSSSCVVRLTSNTDAVTVLQGFNSDFTIKAPSGGSVFTQVNGNESAINALANGAVELYYDNSKKLETTSVGTRLYGRTDIGDSTGGSTDDRLTFGEGQDLQIYHDGTDSRINNTTGALQITGNNDFRLKTNGGQNIFKATGNAVELYYDTGSGGSSKKFETTSSGATVTGTLTATAFSGSVSNISGAIANDANNRVLVSDGDGTTTAESDLTYTSNRLTTRHTASGTTYPLFLQNRTNADSRVGIQMIATGSDISDGQFASIEARGPQTGNTRHMLYFKTCVSGGTPTDRFYIDSDGHVLPAANNSYDLGASGSRWRNIYTNDLNLSNEGSSNDVDGTWGSYTIQEGAEDLFLVNKRNGKKYKFALTEVS